MSSGLVILLVVVGVLVVIAAIVIGIYNGLVSSRAHVRESWSNIDTELQRRHDLIPNLVSTVKGYMTHERELLENIVALREQAEKLRPGDPSGEQLEIENKLGAALGQLRVRFEQYPDLKAATNFSQLQAELANTEDRVQAANRFYNANVRDYNIKVESFPSNIIAGVFSFTKATHFELKNEAAREAPVVSF